MDPHNQWKVLLSAFSIIVILMILFSFYLLYRIKNQKIFQIVPDSTKTEALINQKLLDRVAESFLNRELKEKEIKAGATLYKDPS